MPIRFSLPIVACLAMIHGSLPHAASLSTAGTSSPPTTVRVIEYYNQHLDHYFITAEAAEINALDNGILTGWERTGGGFAAFAPTPAGATLSQVCRFYGRPEAGLDSHFYSGAPDECAQVQARFAASWLLESSNVFQVQMPNRASGACPDATIPVYRLFNGRADANHRYTTDPGVRATMISQGFVSEGYGPAGVAFCGLSLPPSEPTAIIAVTQTAPDTFTFTGSATAPSGATIVSFAWDFGDGGTASGPTTTHRYTATGSYQVTLSVADSSNRVATVSKTIAATVSAPPPVPAVLTVNIISTQVLPDTFDFSSSASAPAGASIVSYAWNFGDGGSASGPSARHQYLASGNYLVVLTVADNRGNAASATKSVTAAVTPPPTTTPPSPPASSADFIARRSAPGVVRWFDFDADAQLGQPWSTSMPNFGYSAGTATAPRIDTAVRASGTGSLRFDVPSQSGSNAAGLWFTNFSTDLVTQFGENSEFFVQWRQRFNDAMVNTLFLDQGGVAQAGIKQVILGTGDQPLPWDYNLSSSCSDLEVTTQTYYQSRFPIVYNSCSGSASHGPYAGLYEYYGHSGDAKLQNLMPAPYCTSESVRLLGGVAVPPGCVGWVANEWMTFQLGVTLGPRVGDEFSSSRVRLWVAREGQPSILVLDWKPGVAGYFPLTAGPPTSNQKFGKLFLLPYMTSKNSTQTHGLAQSWYDELIISTARIADPAPSNTVPSGNFPAWRANKPVGQFFEIANTSSMNGYVWPLPMADPVMGGIIDAWNGLASGATTWWSAASGGHGEWQNAVLKIDLASDTPGWSLVHSGSTFSSVNITQPYYNDGLPVSRHTYYTTQFVSGAHARDGKDRVMLFGSYATYGTMMAPRAFSGGPQVDGFRVADNAWDAGGTWADIPQYVYMPAVTKHPVTEDVYVTGGYACNKWTAATGRWDRIVAPQSTSPMLLAWDQMPSMVDASRNRLVGLHDGRPSYGPAIRLQLVNLTTHAVSELPITGAITDVIDGSMLVHDEDADRYLLFRNDTSAVKVYAIDPTTGASTLVTSVAPPIANIYGRVAYFKALGGVAYLPKFTSNILFIPTR